MQATRRSEEEVRKINRNPIHVVLDNVRSALNVGAIFRTCDAVLAERIYLCGITAYPPHNKIPKTAIGATEVVPWEYAKDTESVIRNLKKKNIPIVSVEITPESKKYFKFNFPKPVAVVFGHEIHGVSENILKLSDAAIEIPMLGRGHSLNISTTAGIILYEILRQWQKH